MDLYFYSDESGVFDKEHNKYFVYAGILLIGKEEKEIWNRKYSNYERNIRNNHPGLKNCELCSVPIKLDMN